MPPKAKVPPSVAPEKKNELRLHKNERIALRNIIALRGEIVSRFQQLMATPNADLDELSQGIEERLGLPSGSIGTTHELDNAEGIVREREMPNGQAVEGAE